MRKPKKQQTQNEAAEAFANAGLELDFSESPTTWKFLNNDAFFRGLLGPVGSGNDARKVESDFAIKYTKRGKAYT